MVQVTSTSFSYSSVLFKSGADQKSLVDNQSCGFADMFSGLLKDQTTPLQAEPQTQSISTIVDKLTQSIGTLIKSIETIMDHMKEQMNISMPAGYALRQTSVASRLEITGTFTDKNKMENAVNNNCFLQQTFQAIRIHYTELREYSTYPTTSVNCDASQSTQPFSISFKDGRATINTNDLSAILFDKLIEEMDRNSDKNKNHTKKGSHQSNANWI